MQAQGVSVFILGPSESAPWGREKCRCGDLVSCGVQCDVELASALGSGNSATCYLFASRQVKWRDMTSEWVLTLQPVWGGPVRSFGFGGLCWARRFPVAVAPKISKDRTQTDFVVIIVRVPLSIPTLPLYHRTSPRAVAHRIQFNTIQ